MNNNRATSKSKKRKQEKSSVPKEDFLRAAGSELHQIAGGDHPELSTNQGVALSANRNSRTLA